MKSSFGGVVELDGSGTYDSVYYQSLLAEKDKEIQKLQKMLESSSRKKERVTN